MYELIFALLVAAPAPAVIGSYKDEVIDVQLFDAPCEDTEVLGEIKPKLHQFFKAARGKYEGKPYGLCWAEASGYVLLIWEDGGEQVRRRKSFEEGV